MKDAPTECQPDSISLSPSPNISSEYPSEVKKSIALDNKDTIPPCLQIENDHVPFQLDRSNRIHLSSLRNQNLPLESVSVNISEDLLIPDLDDE